MPGGALLTKRRRQLSYMIVAPLDHCLSSDPRGSWRGHFSLLEPPTPTLVTDTASRCTIVAVQKELATTRCSDASSTNAPSGDEFRSLTSYGLCRDQLAPSASPPAAAPPPPAAGSAPIGPVTTEMLVPAGWSPTQVM